MSIKNNYKTLGQGWDKVYKKILNNILNTIIFLKNMGQGYTKWDKVGTRLGTR